MAMKTWKIRITTLSGEPISQKQAILRYIICWVWFVPPLAFSNLLDIHGLNSLGISILWGLMWALSSKLNPSGQFWQDRWSQTQLTMALDAHNPPN